MSFFKKIGKAFKDGVYAVGDAAKSGWEGVKKTGEKFAYAVGDTLKGDLKKASQNWKGVLEGAGQTFSATIDGLYNAATTFTPTGALLRATLAGAGGDKALGITESLIKGFVPFYGAAKAASEGDWKEFGINLALDAVSFLPVGKAVAGVSKGVKTAQAGRKANKAVNAAKKAAESGQDVAKHIDDVIKNADEALAGAKKLGRDADKIDALTDAANKAREAQKTLKTGDNAAAAAQVKEAADAVRGNTKTVRVATGEAVSNGAKATGKAVSNAGKATVQGIQTVGKKISNPIGTAQKAGSAVKNFGARKLEQVGKAASHVKNAFKTTTTTGKLRSVHKAMRYDPVYRMLSNSVTNIGGWVRMMRDNGFRVIARSVPALKGVDDVAKAATKVDDSVKVANESTNPKNIIDKKTAQKALKDVNKAIDDQISFLEAQSRRASSPKEKLEVSGEITAIQKTKTDLKQEPENLAYALDSVKKSHNNFKPTNIKPTDYITHVAQKKNVVLTKTEDGRALSVDLETGVVRLNQGKAGGDNFKEFDLKGITKEKTDEFRTKGILDPEKASEIKDAGRIKRNFTSTKVIQNSDGSVQATKGQSRVTVSADGKSVTEVNGNDIFYYKVDGKDLVTKTATLKGTDDLYKITQEGQEIIVDKRTNSLFTKKGEKITHTKLDGAFDTGSSRVITDNHPNYKKLSEQLENTESVPKSVNVKIGDNGAITTDVIKQYRGIEPKGIASLGNPFNLRKAVTKRGETRSSITVGQDGAISGFDKDLNRTFHGKDLSGGDISQTFDSVKTGLNKGERALQKTAYVGASLTKGLADLGNEMEKEALAQQVEKQAALEASHKENLEDYQNIFVETVDDILKKYENNEPIDLPETEEIGEKVEQLLQELQPYIDKEEAGKTLTASEEKKRNALIEKIEDYEEKYKEAMLIANIIGILNIVDSSLLEIADGDEEKTKKLREAFLEGARDSLEDLDDGVEPMNNYKDRSEKDDDTEAFWKEAGEKFINMAYITQQDFFVPRLTPTEEEEEGMVDAEKKENDPIPQGAIENQTTLA